MRARANITMDATLLRKIDQAAASEGIARSAFLVRAATKKLADTERQALWVEQQRHEIKRELDKLRSCEAFITVNGVNISTERIAELEKLLAAS